jgi:SAM-dependent methyltransferase
VALAAIEGNNEGMSVPLAKILTVVVVLGAVVAVASQCRKPRSLLGRFFIWLMSHTHAGVTRWGLEHVKINPGDTILDVGCGGGRGIRTLALMARKVYGVDYSPTSVAAARRHNADLIAVGRVDIREASVSALPFADATFDVVGAVETHYYWPEPVKDFQEILRVLKPGGTLLLIAETHRDQTFSALLILPMVLLRARYLTVQEHRDILRVAGFENVVVDSQARKGWICIVARRPEAAAARASA